MISGNVLGLNISMWKGFSLLVLISFLVQIEKTTALEATDDIPDGM